MPNPNIDFFSGEPEKGAGANGDKPADDTFAGMQELNLFDDAPETDSQRASDATQVFDVNRAETVKPAAQLYAASSSIDSIVDGKYKPVIAVFFLKASIPIVFTLFGTVM